jgi:iron(III) transport system permease protein
MRLFRANHWTLGSAFTAALISLPVLIICGFAFAPSDDIWRHLAATVLPDYIAHSVALTGGVAALSLVIGVATAWLTSMCEFPGRRQLQWALLLPLAAPAYIIGFTYAGLLAPAGAVQEWLRLQTGWNYGEYWFPDIRSLPGAVFILALVLYPYVYMLGRSAFLAQSVCSKSAARWAAVPGAVSFR